MPIVNGTTYDDRTPEAVISQLERARLAGDRVRLFLGDIETGKSWDEEHDVTGTISRSMGPRKVPILLANRRSTGGGSILDHCIVGLQRNGRWVYRHPSLDLGQWSTGPAESEGYIEAAYKDGELHAQFKREGAAARYVAFMRGDRGNK